MCVHVCVCVRKLASGLKDTLLYDVMVCVCVCVRERESKKERVKE